MYVHTYIQRSASQHIPHPSSQLLKLNGTLKVLQKYPLLRVLTYLPMYVCFLMAANMLRWHRSSEPNTQYSFHTYTWSRIVVVINISRWLCGQTHHQLIPTWDSRSHPLFKVNSLVYFDDWWYIQSQLQTMKKSTYWLIDILAGP